jgi:HCOMODA/2-hydroxy-3-carboxy-muconic semialdehyde decarboxylase
MRGQAVRDLLIVLASLALAAGAVEAQPRSARVTALIEDLVAANRILAMQGILPGYGHVSARHPENPNRYFLSRSLAPELVTADDVVELDLDSVAVDSAGKALYLERFIHGEIYKARPDVQAIVHSHSAAVVSFSVGSTPLRAVTHDAAFLLGGVPIWDYRDFGTAKGALVDTPERGRALAAKLADRPLVLMRNHGVALVGRSLPGVVEQSVWLEKNAQIQSDLLARGDEIIYLELDAPSGSGSGGGNAGGRAWELWKRQVSSGAR